MPAWEPKYSVRIPQLDAQHTELFRLLDELSDGIEKDLPLDIEYAVIKLDVYSLYHFASEEHLMKKYGYKALAAHLEQHEDFRWRIEGFRERLAGDKRALALEIRGFLEDWICNHILESDKQYAPFLAERIKAIPF